jgi:hypothetical protein
MKRIRFKTAARAIGTSAMALFILGGIGNAAAHASTNVPHAHAIAASSTGEIVDGNGSDYPVACLGAGNPVETVNGPDGDQMIVSEVGNTGFYHFQCPTGLDTGQCLKVNASESDWLFPGTCNTSTATEWQPEANNVWANAYFEAMGQTGNMTAVVITPGSYIQAIGGVPLGARNRWAVPGH